MLLFDNQIKIFKHFVYDPRQGKVTSNQNENFATEWFLSKWLLFDSANVY